MKTAISTKHLTVKLEGHVLLDNITLEILPGRVVGLLGPSGAGKTTLMRAIMGLERIAGGTVEVLGRPAGSKWQRDKVGYVTQAPAVYQDLTVRENLHFFAAMVGASKSQAESVMADVQLVPQSSQLVGTLSGGQRARVSLAVALLGDPQVLILDEPTVGLDPILRGELWSRFHELARAGKTLVVSSHVMDEARRCDDLLLMREGRLLAASSPKALMTKTHTPDVEQAFLKLVEQPA